MKIQSRTSKYGIGWHSPEKISFGDLVSILAAINNGVNCQSLSFVLRIFMAKKRLFVLIQDYPQLSQTYKENEIKYLYSDFEVVIGSFESADLPYKQHYPYRIIHSMQDVLDIIDEFKPDIIHGHYLHTTDTLHAASKYSGAPFTVRSHSFDIINRSPDYIKRYATFVNSDQCAGMLVFPFLINYLVQCGIHKEKLIADWPVVDYDRFYDRSPNGKQIMNTGACIPKKNMESFVDLAAKIRNRKFVLYPIGYLRDELAKYNASFNNPVEMRETVEPFDMPAIYKQSEWLVYTANKKIPTVGWPVAIAEAQAAGVGVLVQRIRPDIEHFIGGAGFVFDELDEAAKILSQPYPEEMRERGFENAKRSDIKKNIRKLHALWQ
jgi:hypothetical protein